MRTPGKLRLLLSAVGVLLLGAALDAAAAAHGDSDPRTSQAVLEFIQSEMRERQIPGLQIVVIKNQKIVLSKALGIASLQYGVPVADNSVFSINSATKSFTGVAIMQLVELGKIELQAPVARYLADLPADWQAVTIAQLLAHTSGIPDILDQRSSGLVAGTPEASWKAVQTLPMEFAPGQRFSYNQTNYLLLGKIIERLSGEPFLQFIQRKQFDAVGMPNSSFGDSLDVIKNKANSYRLADDGTTLKNVIEDFPASMRTGAGINTSAQELAKWLVALQQGRLLKTANLVQLWTPSTYSDGKPAPWAMGWPAIRRGEHRAVAGIGGGRSAFYVYPEDDLAVIILTNLAGAQPEQLIDTVAGYYLPALRKINGGGYALYRLREQFGPSGFDDIDKKLRQVTEQYAVSAPSDGALNAWGYRLLAKRQTKSAIAVLALAAQRYPDSANAHDSLAEAYEADSATGPAIQHYRRSLELNPKNQPAIDRLKLLEQK
ncbi:serine hydrolase [Rugamonas sp. CCM 8940]|uniref:serine hydrolase domain-containing protein n=1 Tax=Rugamonas sp. CCM 8940 TaxID=2765359 RepID=UPI0018F78173|nr:serine hydrolase domain-containing protein [Rugamonas sp. CCM 8940]MBJ7313783.1 serine hydrolase [Rugamonas sp. CCM 8940]